MFPPRPSRARPGLAGSSGQRHRARADPPRVVPHPFGEGLGEVGTTHRLGAGNVQWPTNFRPRASVHIAAATSAVWRGRGLVGENLIVFRPVAASSACHWMVEAKRVPYSSDVRTSCARALGHHGTLGFGLLTP